MNQAARLLMSVLTIVPVTVSAVVHPAPPHVLPSDYDETVHVTATRLPGDAELRNVPAHVTVIRREQIEAAEASTLQDLLVRQAGIMLHDQVGNDLQKTLDLRGLGGGSGTRVFLDGAPINDPRNNTLSLELIPLQSLERIEIIRGSAASLAGGGSQAGAIHLTSRRGSGEPTGSLSVAAGSFDSTGVRGDISGRRDRMDYFISAQVENAGGFRDNAGGDASRFAATLGTDFSAGRRFELTALGSAVDYGNPGALAAAEIARDRERAPFNTLDHTDQSAGQLALNYRGALAGSWSMAANLFYRDRATESLTTGRAAAAFGGFFLNADESSFGSTVQLSHKLSGKTFANQLTMGLEWLDSDTDASGFVTAPDALNTVDAADLSSDNTTNRRTMAAFVQSSWQPSDAFGFMLGLRGDRDRVGYDERFPAAGNDDGRTFSELSLRAGATWQPRERLGVYASYGEAYLPPTVEQMYSFPTFGSNPGLEPEDSESWEVGLRLYGGDGPTLDLALFVIDKDNEIVFDPSSPLGTFGANVNAGSTRREGIEASVRGAAAPGLDYYTTLTMVDAEFRNGADNGRTVPLVPAYQISAGLDADLSRTLTLSVDALYVGRQVLDNDAGRTQPKLDDYAVFDARLAWRTPFGRGRGDESGLQLVIAAKNLFDADYATRGIYAFDFSTFLNNTFLTPAPGRRVHAGARYRF